MLFNDRYGMHRVYYHESKDAFYFAAEAKAILAVCPELRRMDPRGVGEFIACGAVLENRTLFDGIHVLPPASAWVFRNGSLERKGSYFHPREWEDQETLDPESYYRELRVAFTQNLPRYFDRPRADRNVVDGWIGHPNDHGLAEVRATGRFLVTPLEACSAIVKMSVLSRRVASSVRAAAPGNHCGKGIPWRDFRTTLSARCTSPTDAWM